MSRKIYQSTKSKEVHEELESLDSSLPGTSYKVAFEMPEDFWEKQKSAILREVEKENKPQERQVGKYIYLKYAAAAAVLFLVMWMLPNQNAVSNTNLSLDTIELSALEDYLLDEVESMDMKLSLEETFYDQELWLDDGLENESNE